MSQGAVLPEPKKNTEQPVAENTSDCIEQGINPKTATKWGRASETQLSRDSNKPDCLRPLRFNCGRFSVGLLHWSAVGSPKEMTDQQVNTPAQTRRYGFEQKLTQPHTENEQNQPNTTKCVSRKRKQTRKHMPLAGKNSKIRHTKSGRVVLVLCKKQQTRHPTEKAWTLQVVLDQIYTAL